MNVKDCFSQGLLVDVEPSREKAEKSLESACEILGKAEDNQNMGHHDVCLILCYTAMFHAARAVLFRDGVKERSHVCIPLYLKSRHPELDKEANTLDAYRRARHSALYGLDIATAREDAETALEMARDILARMRGVVGTD